MPTLIACLSTGKGTWSEVILLMKGQAWDRIFLITNSFGKENFTPPVEQVEFVVIDTFQEISAIKEIIKKQLQGKIKDFEVALNMVSGSGKEHMALLEAVLELGLNFRLITISKGNIDVLGMGR